MNAKSHTLELHVESRQVEEAVSSLIHTILLHRSTGKFNYKREGTYSVGTIGMKDVTCDFVDFTYVKVNSTSLSNTVSTHLENFLNDMHLKRQEKSSKNNKIIGTFTIEFYQKRRNTWPFSDECIPWEVWNIVVKESILLNESERQVAQENIGFVLADKVFCITEAMNRHDFVPKMPTQSEADLVFDMAYPDVQPYLFKITHQVVGDGETMKPRAAVENTVKRMFRETLTIQ